MLARLTHVLALTAFFAVYVVGAPARAQAPTPADGRGLFTAAWVSVPVSPGNSVNVPQDNWTALGAARVWSCDRDGDGQPNDPDCRARVELLAGERWVTYGNESAGMLGLRGDQVAALVQRLPGAGTVVIGRYMAETAQLRINVLRVQRDAANVSTLYIADFTPHHGERWAAARHYLDVVERADPTRAGRNPFTANRGAANDPLFYNIGWDAAQVAVGHAMAFYRAPQAFVSKMIPSFSVRQSQSGNVFRKRVTTTYTGTGRPEWYVALPQEVTRYGQSAQVCTVRYADAQCAAAGFPAPPDSARPPDSGYCCLAADHVAVSGIVLVRWDRMQECQDVNGATVCRGEVGADAEEQYYQTSETKSSLTILSFALLLGVAFAGAATLATTLFPQLVVALGSVGSSFNIAGIVGIAATTTYAVGSVVSGGGPVTSPQARLFGGTHFPATSPTEVSGARQRTFLSEVGQRQLLPEPFAEAGVGGVSGNAFATRGGCVPAETLSSCTSRGEAAGSLPRSDLRGESPTGDTLRRVFSQCHERGLRGAELARCAASSPSSR